jgi:uncharacterized protein YbgA (DUF1722 family)
MGFSKNYLPSEDKQELLGIIEDYRQGLLPLIVPLTLLKHQLHRRNDMPLRDRFIERVVPVARARQGQLSLVGLLTQVAGG